MKYFIVVIIAVAGISQVTPQEYSDQTKQAITKCSGQFPSAPTAVINEDRLPENDDEKCLLECLFNEIGLIQNGEFSVEGTKKLVDSLYTDAAEKAEGHRVAEECGKEMKNKVDEKCWLGSGVRQCKKKTGSSIKLL